MGTMVSLPAKTSRAAPAAARVGPASPRFWACTVILAAAAVGVQVLPQLFDIHLQKKAVPLKKKLQLFDVARLGPRYELHRAAEMIPPLSEDEIDGLGTSDVLRTYLTDTDKPEADPTHVAYLFVTYYTGKPDMVPHVPEECFLAGGYDPIGRPLEYRVAVPKSASPNDGEIAVRALRFLASQSRRASAEGADEVVVMYFFHVNGGYATTRNEVRVRLSNPLQRYAYYAKIEVSFMDGYLKRGAGLQASVAALEPLLGAVLPVLLEDHLDLDEFAAAAGANGDGRD